MATTRGRMVKVGGVARQDGAMGRTDPNQTNTGGSTLLRPAFTFNAGILKPTMPATLSSFLDPRSIAFWRLALVGLAGLYIMGFHMKLPILGRVRV